MSNVWNIGAVDGTGNIGVSNDWSICSGGPMYSGRAGFSDLPPSFLFANVSGGSSSVFKSGETWRVEITGPSNQVVWLVANGLAPINMGSTDANGRFAKQGTVGDGEIGNWGELWYVGPDFNTGMFIGSVSFSVVAQPSKPTGPMDVPHQAQTGVVLPIDGGSIGSMLAGLPSWAIWGGAGLLAFSLLKGKR